MYVLQVGQSAQYGLWSKEVMIEVHDTHIPFPWVISFFDLGSDTLHKFVLGFLLHVQPNEKLFLEARLTQGVVLCHRMPPGPLTTHCFVLHCDVVACLHVCCPPPPCNPAYICETSSKYIFFCDCG